MSEIDHAMQCNIDAKGKVARLISGVVFLLAGLIFVALRWFDVLGSDWMYVGAGVAMASGVVAVFEAKAGWCVIRAMGFRTPV